MSNKAVKELLKDVLFDVADAIETGDFGQKLKIGITLYGSEHGSEELLRGAELAQKNNPDIQVVCIGPSIETDLEVVEVENEEEQHKKMEELLDSNQLAACVTMHYSFPIGVSTVGKVIAPANGKELYIANTTGTSATDRVEAMVKNTISGISVAKACGVKDPKVGILNIEGARAVERALSKLKESGYEFSFTESMRADGGSVMRGNDLLAATPDVMVMDSLTGNVMMKMFSSYTTGGSYEASGFGYGPGIGQDYDRIIMILSRASGAPVAAKAIEYGAQVAKGEVNNISKTEFKSAKIAGLDSVVEVKKEAVTEEVEMPPKKNVTEEIPGIEILDLEDAAKAVWKKGIYAETGMGCSGPVILVAPKDHDKAYKVLQDANYIS